MLTGLCGVKLPKTAKLGGMVLRRYAGAIAALVSILFFNLCKMACGYNYSSSCSKIVNRRLFLLRYLPVVGRGWLHQR
jgi:hypothetical protein